MRNGIIESPRYQVPAYVRLRAEPFGGLVFNTKDGTTVEVDRPAFWVFRLLQAHALSISEIQAARESLPKKRKRQGKSLDLLIQEGLGLGILLQLPPHSETPASEITPWVHPEFRFPWLSGPETVHWAVTYRCTQACPDCYVSRTGYDRNRKELCTAEALALIDRIRQWQPFQLALGGGEPFARQDLADLAGHAASIGLCVHVTTGQSRISPERLAPLAGSIKVLQIGVQADKLDSAITPNYAHELGELRNFVENLGIHCGANLFLNRSNLKQLERIIDRLVEIGFLQIILLRYKPPADLVRWQQNRPESESLCTLHHRIRAICEHYPEVKLRVDCALDFIQRGLQPEVARRNGIRGCVAGERIVAVAQDGSVYPCSQLVHPRFSCGNLTELDPEAIWNDSAVLRKFRNFRVQKSFIHSACGPCLAKEFCGGCRVFARDGLGGDPWCPEPVWPPLTQVGKVERSVDFAQYIERQGSVSVGEYMERYDVGKKTAIKELKKAPNVFCSAATGRQSDLYESSLRNCIADVQDAIGYTAAGFPYATSEEISEWLSEKDEDDYPHWIQNTNVILKG